MRITLHERSKCIRWWQDLWRFTPSQATSPVNSNRSGLESWPNSFDDSHLLGVGQTAVHDSHGFVGQFQRVRYGAGEPVQCRDRSENTTVSQSNIGRQECL